MNLKRINRGLVLGAVLIIGTAGYVIYDNARFSENKEDIRKTVEAYFDLLCDVNTADSSDEVISNSEKLLADWWIYDSSEVYRWSSKRYYLEDLSYYKTGYDGSGKTDAYDLSLDIKSITKNGPGGATVKMNVSAYYEYSGTPLAFTPSGAWQLGDSYYNEYGEYEEPDASLKYKQTSQFDDLTVDLYYQDGEWKITSIEAWGFYDEMPQVISEEGGQQNGEQ